MSRFKSYLLLLFFACASIVIGSTVCYAQGGVKDVKVVNTTAEPVPARDVDNPARQPFQLQLSVTIPDGHINTIAYLNFKGSDQVPAGKRLVIEQISARALMPFGQKQKAYFSFKTTVNSQQGEHFLIANAQGPIIALDSFVANQQMRVYADPGTSVPVDVRRSAATGEATAIVTFSGYFVSVP